MTLVEVEPWEIEYNTYTIETIFDLSQHGGHAHPLWDPNHHTVTNLSGSVFRWGQRFRERQEASGPVRAVGPRRRVLCYRVTQDMFHHDRAVGDIFFGNLYDHGFIYVYNTVINDYINSRFRTLGPWAYRNAAAA